MSILESVNKAMTTELMRNGTKNCVCKLDESQSDKVDVSFDVLGRDDKAPVRILFERMGDKYAYCKVTSPLMEYETRVPYGIITNFVNSVAEEIQGKLLDE